MLIGDKLRKLFRREDDKFRELPRQVVKHTGVDKLEFDLYSKRSGPFREIVLDSAPKIIPPDAEVEVPNIDISTATPEELRDYQEKHAARERALEDAPTYDYWEPLMRDWFYSLIGTRGTGVDIVGEDEPLDPVVAPHRQVIQMLTSREQFGKAKPLCRGDALMSGITLMAGVEEAGDDLKSTIHEQMVASQRLGEQIEQTRGLIDDLEALRDQAREQTEEGQPVTPDLVSQIKEAIKAKRESEGATQAASEQQHQVTQALIQATEQAAEAGLEAAEAAKDTPQFGHGFGRGEPRFESPEQAIEFARAWSKGILKEIAERYGRFDKDMRFKRAKRTVGGQEEIVGIKAGDDLRHVTGEEWALAMQSDTLKQDFFTRLVAGDAMVYKTVGETHAGRGPIILCVDGSGSMSGARNVFARAVALALLHISRAEKRDFHMIEFSTSVEQWQFKAKDALDPNEIVKMASHFFGGGTVPLLGIEAAIKLMREAPAFRKADVILIGDGECTFGDQDEAARDTLTEMGVRIHGIGIGGSFAYLEAYCGDEQVVPVTALELDAPSEATTMLAEQIT